MANTNKPNRKKGNISGTIHFPSKEKSLNHTEDKPFGVEDEIYMNDQGLTKQLTSFISKVPLVETPIARPQALLPKSPILDAYKIGFEPNQKTAEMKEENDKETNVDKRNAILYDEYLDEFMPSEELRTFLKTQSLQPWQITELIFYSPVPLVKKRIALESLLKEAQILKDNDLILKCLSFLCDMNLAEELLAEDGIFTVESCFYDTKGRNSFNYLCNVCNTFEQVKSLVNKDWKENEYLPDDTVWHEVKKWVRKKGKYEESCTYIFIKQKACLIDPLHGARKKMKHTICDGIDLRLPLPYQPGDILEIDCRPFKEKAVVIVGQNLYPDDCCSPQVLSKGEGEKWTFGSIKHGQLFDWHLDQRISALYRLKKLQDFVPKTEDEKLLLAIKEFIDQCEDKDKLYSETWFTHYTTVEFMDAIDRLKNHQPLQ